MATEKTEKYEYKIRPVALIENCFTEKFGIPRQSGRASGVMSRIVFTPDYRDPESLRDIEGFSHLWLLFGFSESRFDSFSPTARPPRLGGNRRVGVFASRSPFRPNGLGLSSVKLEKVELSGPSGPVLTVSGADLMNGTPIYDIKPYLPQYDSHPEADAGYSGLFTSYSLDVLDPSDILSSLPPDIASAARECISDDPRPSYQNDPSRTYHIRLGRFEISFTVSSGTALITGAGIF